ncbi:hypothetical protein AB0H86_29790 [Streptomyces sp. NPDC050997]|uniref:hypothetical protein n=1 Tax=Streptomyces sp. NPDC050997 TaxID=3155519 RepID=UPI00342EFAB1
MPPRAANLYGAAERVAPAPGPGRERAAREPPGRRPVIADSYSATLRPGETRLIRVKPVSSLDLTIFKVGIS